MSVNVDETVRTPTEHRDPGRSADAHRHDGCRASRSTRSEPSTSGSRSSWCSRSGCPRRSPTSTTAKQILNSNAITGLAALSVTIPLAARVFDLSFALNMTLCGVAVAHFVVDGVPLVAGGRRWAC